MILLIWYTSLITFQTKTVYVKSTIMGDQNSAMLEEWLERDANLSQKKNSSEKLEYRTRTVGVVLRLLFEIKTENREQIHICKTQLMSAKAETSKLHKEMTDLQKEL